MLAGLIATVVAGPVYVLTVCAVVAIGKRIVLAHAPVGIHRVRCLLGVRKWIADKLLEFSLMFTNSLYATLYTVPWLRVLGARVGRGAEVSTAAHLDPDLLILAQECFVADMASVGSRHLCQRPGRVPAHRGRQSGVRRQRRIRAGRARRLGDGSLIGVGTVPPGDRVPDGTSWLGSPAMHLPVRQSSGFFAEEQTFRPRRGLVAHRLAIESSRATLPASVLGLTFYLYLLVLSELANGRALPVPALVAPFAAVAASIAVIAYCAATKRNVVGTYRPRVEPLWSTFVRRAEFVTGLYEAAAVPAGLGLLVGTPFLPPVLRWFGARIGRRTWIGTTYLTEFDLVEIGDDATVGTEVSLQTHLFEDRVMKMSVVTVGAGATIGTREHRAVRRYGRQRRLAGLALAADEGRAAHPGYPLAWHSRPGREHRRRRQHRPHRHGAGTTHAGPAHQILNRPVHERRTPGRCAMRNRQPIRPKDIGHIRRLRPRHHRVSRLQRADGWHAT